jgi:hypothetical protein
MGSIKDFKRLYKALGCPVWQVDRLLRSSSFRLARVNDSGSIRAKFGHDADVFVVVALPDAVRDVEISQYLWVLGGRWLALLEPVLVQGIAKIGPSRAANA